MNSMGPMMIFFRTTDTTGTTDTTIWKPGLREGRNLNRLVLIGCRQTAHFSALHGFVLNTAKLNLLSSFPEMTQRRENQSVFNDCDEIHLLSHNRMKRHICYRFF